MLKCGIRFHTPIHSLRQTQCERFIFYPDEIEKRTFHGVGGVNKDAKEKF